MIYGVLLVFHILISFVLMLVILLQSGKGGGLAGAFGAAGGQTGQMLFGGRGAATFLSKATAGLGTAFLVTSLVLAIMQASASGPTPIVRSGGDPMSIAPPIDAPSPTTPGALDLGTGTTPGEGTGTGTETTTPGETTPPAENNETGTGGN